MCSLTVGKQCVELEAGILQTIADLEKLPLPRTDCEAHRLNAPGRASESKLSVARGLENEQKSRSAGILCCGPGEAGFSAPPPACEVAVGLRDAGAACCATTRTEYGGTQKDT